MNDVAQQNPSVPLLDRLFPAKRRGADVVEELTGDRPHPNTVLRWIREGCHGERLKTISRAGTRLSTRRWLLDFWARCECARRKARPPESNHRPRGRGVAT